MGAGSLESRKHNPEKSRKRTGKRRITCAISGLILLVLCVGGWAYLGYRDHWMSIQAQIDILPEQNAKKGRLYGDEVQEVAMGSFWVLLNQLPSVEEGSLECSIKYENPDSNEYSARISLYLKETGELLGNTKRVDPGRYVETLRLKKELPLGEYPARVNLELFKGKTPAGNLSVDVILQVVEKREDTKAESGGGAEGEQGR